IADALALVGLGRPLRAYFGRDLADELPVDTADHDLGLRRGRHLDALGHLLHHRVREAEREIQLVTLRLGAEADADQRQFLLEAPGHAGHHVGDQRPHRARHGVGVVRVAERLEDDALALLLHFDVRVRRARDGAERAFHRDLAAGERHLDAFRQRHGIFGDAGHIALRYATMQSTSPPTPSARALRSVITPREV